ncbi:hypothetical protein BU23DRAFT_662938 [Bimuria novae-zelandiae CBS 107.79]|uniref:Ankyrin n=1 Tax=Bimuria novae-zelandiae CBS 107.79 TaxID=1447943 RepID=A0A6A5VJT1_9PLEO|nr:hypothetical protein BU23DRAFT_662938 [Bimuria novae-zelandiae CBS 107.79]
MGRQHPPTYRAMAFRYFGMRPKVVDRIVKIPDRQLCTSPAVSPRQDLRTSTRTNTRYGSLLLFAALWIQPNIARLCFSHGVDADYIVSDGITALMPLYHVDCKPLDQTEFIDLLACNSYTEVDRQDASGWSALHRAAAFGTCQDVKKGHLRGWNLLHVAVGAGNFEAIPFFVQHSVGPEAKSNATSRAVLRLLEHERVTPSQVARIYGEESYRVWCEAMRSCGRAADPSFDDVEWSTEDEDSHIGANKLYATVILRPATHFFKEMPLPIG